MTDLIKEAKRRGFKRGVMFTSAATRSRYVLVGNIKTIQHEGFITLNARKGCIYDGETNRWAEIINTD